jgi:LEA14-like dessication related protein
MKTKTILRVTIGIVVTAIIGVAAFLYLNPKKALHLVLPDFTGENFVKARIKNDTAYIHFKSYLTNVSPFTIYIDSVFYTVLLDTVPIISERSRLNLSQKGGAVDTAIFNFKIPIKKLQHVIKNLQSQDSTIVSGQFELLCNTFFGNMNVGFSKKQKIRVPTPPDIKVVKVNRRRINLRENTAQVDVELQIINYSPSITVQLANIGYAIQFGEQIAAKGSFYNQITVKPNSSTFITLPLTIHIDKPLRTLWDIYFNKAENNYKVALTATLSNDKITEIPIEIEATGKTVLIK